MKIKNLMTLAIATCIILLTTGCATTILPRLVVQLCKDHYEHIPTYVALINRETAEQWPGTSIAVSCPGIFGDAISGPE